MSTESNTLFKPTVSNQPLTVLLLIENSQKICSVWSELGECYLNELISTMTRNNPTVASLAVMESSVETSGTHPRFSHTPSVLPNVNFDFTSNSRISPSRVNDCIQHLDDSVHALNELHSLHLIIVAASTPSDDCTGITSTSGKQAPWEVLAEKLSERNIHCHLIIISGEDVTPLNILFQRTLHLQNNVEASPPFQIDPHRYKFRLSARPFYPQYGDFEQNASGYAVVPGANALGTTFRRNSYLDSHYDGNLPPSSVTAFTPQNDISLVSHLKRAQGLTKKKPHSKDPQPAPFIAVARVQEQTSQPYANNPSSSPTSISPPSSASPTSSASTLASTSPPTSAAASLSSIPLTSRHRKPQSLAMAGFSNALPETITNPTNGGRAMSIIKADRRQRVNQASCGSSPTESVHAHMRRNSQAHMQGAVVGGTMNGSGQGSPGSWYAQGPPQMQQVQYQRGSRLSTPDHDVMPSSALSAGTLGPGSANGIGAGGGRGATFDLGTAGSNVSSDVAPASEGPGISVVGMANGLGSHDISPGSASSYISSDMSCPTTPGSTEDLSSYARSHALHHQGIPYQFPYQQNGSQDSFWAQRQNRQQSAQMQEAQAQAQMLQHQEDFTQFLQTGSVQQSHLYPTAYDPGSNYFPSQTTVPSQQYYLPLQNGPTHHAVPESIYQPGVAGTATTEDVQTQQPSIPLQYPGQAIRQPQISRQSYNDSYSQSRPPVTESPPPMIVPSQSHVPLTAVDQATGPVSTTTSPTTEMPVVSRSSPPRPNNIRTSSGQQAHGRTRASTVATSSGLKNTSPSKIAKSKRHKKSASSVSHSALLPSTNDPQVSSSSGDETVVVSPLFAASTAVLYQYTFNRPSGLLGGPGALANAEDVALMAPALGLGEGPNVLATFPIGAMGGLFRSHVKERGGVIDDATGTALVSVPAAAVALPAEGGQSSPSVTTKGDMTAIQSFVDDTMSRPTYPHPSPGSAGRFPYSYEGQQVHYGTLSQ